MRADHVMEFTSATPPPELLPYFGVEGPYLVSIALVVWRLATATTPSGPAKSVAKKKAR